MNGADGLRLFFPEFVGKIERDDGIPEHVLQSFWDRLSDLEGAEVQNVTEDHFAACCEFVGLCGPEVQLENDETLASAQLRLSVANAISSQFEQQPELLPDKPILRPAEVDEMLTNVENNQDVDAALVEFHDAVGHLRLRTLRPEGRTRIFAFRSDHPPASPMIGDLEILFDRLALPPGDFGPEDYIMVAFDPKDAEFVRRPTCFDAGLVCRDVFEPGGMTSPDGMLGVSEVVTPPPLCADVVVAPRRVK